jgi:hypothetical protein
MGSILEREKNQYQVVFRPRKLYRNLMEIEQAVPGIFLNGSFLFDIERVLKHLLELIVY